MAKLLRQPMRDMLESDFLTNVDSLPIEVYRVKIKTKMSARKWLAPLYRPTASILDMREGNRFVARLNNKTVDIEFVNGAFAGEVYSCKLQTWKEKLGYFELVVTEKDKIIVESRKDAQHGKQKRRRRYNRSGTIRV